LRGRAMRAKGHAFVQNLSALVAGLFHTKRKRCF
jgi:hypothetical protein